MSTRVDTLGTILSFVSAKYKAVHGSHQLSIKGPFQEVFTCLLVLSLLHKTYYSTASAYGKNFVGGGAEHKLTE